MNDAWWRDAVIYQIYPRSWADSDGDGIGDLRGVIERLDHLSWLGVDAIWLNPTMPSPNADWGYDVSDYRAVHPDLGTIEDLQELVERAADGGIRVLLDLVPNHTSDRHPWFLEAARSRDSTHRKWYVWADPGPDGGPPNNWLSVFGGGSAWTLHEPTGQYYLHNFLSAQPDLNWWHPEVGNAFDDILTFWFDLGIAGFRIDVVHGIVKDAALRDNPPAGDSDHPEIRRVGQRPVFNMNRPEVHDVIRRWRRLGARREPERVLLGEAYVFDPASLATFYGDGGDELNLAFNFAFAFSSLGASMSDAAEATLDALPEGAAPVWFGSNHDVGRLATRWAAGDEGAARCALIALLMLPGSAVLYYGDEIALEDVTLVRDDLKDPVGMMFWPDQPGRDRCRTPMVWEASPGGGFSAGSARPWLPLGPLDRNVAEQRADPASTLHLCRKLVELRHSTSHGIAGYERLGSPEAVWAWRRGSIVVALNLGDEATSLPGTRGEILVDTTARRAAERVSGELLLSAWEGVVLATTA